MRNNRRHSIQQWLDKEMSSLVFLFKVWKTEKPGEEFTNKDGSTICKECWLNEENNNKENNRK